jgi:MFS family permease
MKLKEKIKQLSDNKRMFYILLILCLFGAIVFIPFCATKLLSWGWEIGFLFGSLVSGLALLLIVVSTTMLSKDVSSSKAVSITILFFVLRIALYVGALVLGAFFQYKWNLESVMNLFGVFIGLLPMQIAVIISMLFKRDNTKNDLG